MSTGAARCHFPAASDPYVRQRLEAGTPNRRRLARETRERGEKALALLAEGLGDLRGETLRPAALRHARPIGSWRRHASSPVGELLRDWRKRRRLSQFELAPEAGVSLRHLSFVETGRSRPSAEIVQHVDVPLRERNQLLLAAGYARMFGQRDLDHRSSCRCERRSTSSSALTKPEEHVVPAGRPDKRSLQRIAV